MRAPLLLSLTAALASGTAAAALPPFGHELRPYFFFDDKYTQLNHGAYGGTPRPVLEAQFAYMQKMESGLDTFMNGDAGYRSCIIAARTTLASLVNAANVNDTVLVDNASEAINAILRNFEPPLSADEYLLDLSTAYGPFQGLYAWMGSRTGMRTLTVQIQWPVTGPESFIEPVRAALAASKMFSFDENQSLVWPRSRKSWNAASMMLSRAKPMTSKCGFCFSPSGGRKVRTPSRQAAPTGRLM